VSSLLERLGLPVRLANPLSFAAILRAMQSDKKNRMTRVHFALPSAIGCTVESGGWTQSAAEPAIEAALGAIA
jgi:3-dehydroquinate synthetase